MASLGEPSQRDLANATRTDTGHYLLDEDGAPIGALMLDFLGRTVAQDAR